MIFLYIALGVTALIAVLCAISWRTVVPNNYVHAIQRRKSTNFYGNGSKDGNVYYNIPSWIPYFGLIAIPIPTSIFKIEIKKYEAYDIKKVPFSVDVTAFLKVVDAVEASKRISSMQELMNQLEETIHGAVRSVLAKHEIDDIMVTRNELSAEFKKEIVEQVVNWGVQLNSIEFMDIDDAQGSSVITDIMNKERSTIEKESRVKVAENKKLAESAEIESAEAIALRDVEKRQKVSVETEKANQLIADQAAVTAEKRMEVEKVNTIKKQAIDNERLVIEAEARATAVAKDAEGDANSKVIRAEAEAKAKQAVAHGDSEAVRKVGTAEADVTQAKGFAEAAATLKKADALNAYNNAGMSIERLNAAVAIEQAKYNAIGKGLEKANIKIVNSGKGVEFMGIPFNAEAGANLGMFMDQAADEAGASKGVIKEVVDGVKDVAKKALKG